MLRIIRGRSSVGSGCFLSDSIDDTISDRDTISDCSVRYFSETGSVSIDNIDKIPKRSSVTSCNSLQNNMDEEATGRPDDIQIHLESSCENGIELQNKGIDNIWSKATATDNNSMNSESFKQDQFTIDQIIERIGFGKFQVKLMFLVGLAWMADGCEMMLLSIIGPTLKCVWFLSSLEEALITTTVFCGHMIGSAFWGWASDRYGRKRCIILSTICVLYFGILSSRSPTYAWIIAIRFLVGFGIGGAPQAVTLVTELLPSATRGRCIVLLELFWAVGSIFAVLLALGTVPTIGWRWFLALITVPLLFFIGFTKWIPESPRYLTSVGRKEEALKVLHKIAADNKTQLPTEKIVTSEIPVARGRLIDLFSREYRFTTSLVWFIWFTSAFSYYGIVLLATEMFQTKIDACHPSGTTVETTACGCNFLTTKDYTDFLWTTVAEVPGILLTIPLIELIGRKKTLALEFFAAAACYLLMLICTNRTTEVVLMFGVRACVTGAFQAAYVYTPEVFPTNVRAVGLGSSSAFARIGAITTPFVAQVLLKRSFYSAIGVYAAILVLCAIASLILPIETKGKALEETTSVSVSYHKEGYDRLR